MPVVLQLVDAHKRYGDQDLLDGASCALADDQKVGLIGRNGAGKSTLCASCSATKSSTPAKSFASASSASAICGSTIRFLPAKPCASS